MISYPNKWASSLAVQKWDYQQKLIDLMGDPAEPAMGDITQPQAASPSTLLSDCGLGLVASAFTGYVAGRVGIVTTLCGVGVSAAIIYALSKRVK